jgi:hypothetical protein
LTFERRDLKKRAVGKRKLLGGALFRLIGAAFFGGEKRGASLERVADERR